MSNLISNWSEDVHTLPETYVLPPDQRPEMVVLPDDNSPIIDLNSHDPVDEIVKAGQDFGFFQVINHGIPPSVVHEAVDVLNEFFRLSGQVKETVFKPDPDKKCRLYTSSFNYDSEKVHFWRDNLAHPCHPLEDCVPLWPEKPIRYREVVRKYTVEIRKLVFRVLDLISLGLGLSEGCFDNELSQIQLLSVNHYPRCPDPSLVLGMQRHSDPNLITILNQGGAGGLQVFKDGHWIAVEPLANAFVVVIGCQLEIISNGKLKSADHRVVTNSEADRTSLGYFVIPTDESVAEPAKDLVDGMNPPAYRACKYKEYLGTHGQKGCEHEAVMECYRLKP